MGEHPYVIPDPGKCPYCGRGRYLHYGEWRHYNNHSPGCDVPTKRRLIGRGVNDE